MLHHSELRGHAFGECIILVSGIAGSCFHRQGLRPPVAAPIIPILLHHAILLLRHLINIRKGPPIWVRVHHMPRWLLDNSVLGLPHGASIERESARAIALREK